MPATSGLHRFIWDLRYPDPEQLLYTYYGIHSDYFEYTLADHAIGNNTPWSEPQGPMVVPGQYEVRLTVGSETLRRPITVKLDPRLTVTQDDLRQQLALAQKLNAGMNATYDAYGQAAQLRVDLAARIAALKQAGKPTDAVTTLDDKAKSFTDANGGFGPMNRDLTRLTVGVQQSDTPPASEIVETYGLMCDEARDVFSRWDDVRTKDLAALNSALTGQSLQPIAVPAPPKMPACR